MTWPRYQKRPVVVEAVQWTGQNVQELELFMLRGFTWRDESGTQADGAGSFNDLFIETLEGEMRADIRDFIIRGVEGELYPCKPSVFYKSYVAVSK
jgi:hypothetical protein